MLVPGDLGFSCLALLSLFFPVIGLVIRHKWRVAVARKEEIKRLLILASEEAARAELETAAVSVLPQFQCAVCYCPTTTRCARCKAVRYCSGKCQIIHWRQGHKEECNPPSITHQIIDESISSSQKAVKQEKYAIYDNRLETEGQQCVKPIETFLSEPAFSKPNCSPEVSCEEDDHIKVEFLADGNVSDSTSKSSSTSFSGFSTSTDRAEPSDNVSVSTTSSELSDDVSVSESINSYDPEKSDGHKSDDSAMPETISSMNTHQTEPFSPEFTGLVDSVNSFTGSSKLNQIKSSCSDVETQSKSSSSGLSIKSCNERSVAQPSTASSGFWEGTLDLNRTRNHAQDDSAQSYASGADSNISDSESVLRFSFNLSGSTIPPLHAEVSESKSTVLDDAHPSTLGIKKPIEGVASSEKISTKALKFRNSPSLAFESSNLVDSGPSNDSHKLKSREVKPFSSSVSNAHPSCSTGRDSISIDAPKARSSSSLSSERSNHVVNGKSGASHQLKSREVESLSSGASDPHLSSSTEGHSVASMRSGKSTVDSDLHLSSSTRGHPVPNVKSGKVDGVHTVAASSSQIANHSPIVSNGLKTSVRKVVDQFRPSKLSKSLPLGVGSEIAGRCSDKGLFSYEVFVKLYIWNKVELRPCGLMNCGNSCYANAVLQCLAFTPPLTSYFLQGLHSKSCLKKEWCFTCEFESLILKAKEGNSPLSPLGILSQIRNIGSHLGNGKEEDAHEFLRYAIDAMQSVCLKEAGVNASGSLEEETSLIGLTFGGYLRSKIKCMKCHGKSERHERMMDLTVEIEGDIGTLEEALHKFTGTEILDGENKYQCSRCKSYEKAKKKLTVSEAPNILTIALKRFQSGKFGKLNKSIRFPEILDLAPFMSGTSDKSPIYRLYAVVVHLDIMNAAFSGHYVCYVKNIQNKWFKIDDSTVKPVELERVLTKGAYMLLYARCSPRAPRLIRNAVIPRNRKLEAASSRNIVKNTTFKLRHDSIDSTAGQSMIHSKPTAYHSRSPVDCPASFESFYSEETRFPWKQRIVEADSSSDNSSLFTEEGSCSTESNRDSTSTEDLSDYIFGDSGRGWSSPWTNSSDSDTSSSSSSLRSSPLAELNRYSSCSTETSRSQTDKAKLVMEGDGFWARPPNGSSKLVDMEGKGDIPFLLSDIAKPCRKLVSNSSSDSYCKETDKEKVGRVNPLDSMKLGVPSRRSTRERTD